MSRNIRTVCTLSHCTNFPCFPLKGGMKAVVWTDTFQFVAMAGCMLAVIICVSWWIKAWVNILDPFFISIGENLCFLVFLDTTFKAYKYILVSVGYIFFFAKIDFVSSFTSKYQRDIKHSLSFFSLHKTYKTLIQMNDIWWTCIVSFVFICIVKIKFIACLWFKIS